jgi:hypothetical protein
MARRGYQDVSRRKTTSAVAFDGLEWALLGSLLRLNKSRGEVAALNWSLDAQSVNVSVEFGRVEAVERYWIDTQGSEMDISLSSIDVRFTPKSGHWNSLAGCLLCAKSGHFAPL